MTTVAARDEYDGVYIGRAERLGLLLGEDAAQAARHRGEQEARIQAQKDLLN